MRFPFVISGHSPRADTLQEDPAAMLDIKEDIREECAKLGDVTNVVLFDKEPAGVASVRFSNATAAEACVRVSALTSLNLGIVLLIYSRC